MSKVYTKTGDKGETSLLGGDRVKKSDELVKLYGSVDELNSFVGMAAVYTFDHKKVMEKIQSSLFDLGALLSCPKDKRETFGLKGISKDFVSELEKEIDKMEELLSELKNFILPGGDISAASLHVARTVSRRVERELVETFLNEDSDESINNALVFLNRLSDFFFVMARYYNKKAGKSDIAWINLN